MMRMIAVGKASQSGTLCASISPLNAVVARRTELRAKARSKSMCQFFKLRSMEHPISLHHARGHRLVQPGYDRYRIATLPFVGERGKLAMIGSSAAVSYTHLRAHE